MMKSYYFSFIFLISNFFAYAQNDAFITTWQVQPNDLSINIPTQGTGYDYTVDFGDGTVLTNQTGDASHTYAATGTYTVNINGIFPNIYMGFISNPDILKIKSVDQWGDIQWQSMEYAFRYCYDLVINATDIPDLSQVNSMKGMFSSISGINQDIWEYS